MAAFFGRNRLARRRFNRLRADYEDFLLQTTKKSGRRDPASAF
jgi:hypothetical protein